MFQTFSVTNFRGFSGLVLKGLDRVNLIAGKNNTGKTALLEALLLHCNPGDTVLPLQINVHRGIEEPSKDVEGVARWLFWQGRAPGISLESQDSEGVTRTVTVQVLDPISARERYPEDEKLLGMRGMIEAQASRVVVKYEQTNSPPVTSIGIGRDGNFHGISGRITWKVPCVLLTSSLQHPDRDVDFFGKVELEKRQGEVLGPLQILEPHLVKLAGVPLAGKLVIHGDVGLPRLIPVPFMGEGVRRVLSIVLAILNAQGGLVLIDEIENGLHYSVQKQVWQAIAEAARQNDVQVFATTHSWECIYRAHEAFSESDEYDFRLHRLDRIDDQIRAVSYDKEMFEAAAATGLEVR
jgi:hypothetical protein